MGVDSAVDDEAVRPASIAAPARAALAGNPSDGHGGAVVAVPLPHLRATVTATPALGFSVHGSDPGDDLWELVAASIRAAQRLLPAHSRAVGHRSVGAHVVVDTTIPRSVGLAGSSAIAIGVVRAVAALDDGGAWSLVFDDPSALAVVAHSAEVDELGIAAGLQDRLVQAYESPVLMDFRPATVTEVLGRPCGVVSPLTSPPGRFLLAHRTFTGESSGVVHGELGRRTDTAEIMAELAHAARAAAAAIGTGSITGLGAAMDRTFDLRNELLQLDPRHVEMIEVARSVGAHANYTGSGGAAIVLCPDRPTQRRAAVALSEIDGCVVHEDVLDRNVDVRSRAQ